MVGARAAFDRVKASVLSVQTAIAGLATVAAARGLTQLASSALESANSLQDTADKLGLATDELQAYRFAAEQTGVAQNTLDTALQRFTRRLGEAQQGTGVLKDTLAENSIALRDAEGRFRSSSDVLADLADTIASTEGSQERLRIAFRAFDSEGAALVNTLSRGSDGLAEFRDEARETGAIIESDLVRRAAEANTRLRAISTTVRTAFQAGLLDSIIDEVEELTSDVDGLSDRAERLGEIAGSALLVMADVLITVADNFDLVTAAGGALIGLRLGSVLGPWGAAIGAVAGALGGYTLATEDATDRTAELQQAVERAQAAEAAARGTLEGLSGAALENAQARLKQAEATRVAAQAEAAFQQAVQASIAIDEVRAELNDPRAAGITGPGAIGSIETTNRLKSELEAAQDAFFEAASAANRLRTESDALEAEVAKLSVSLGGSSSGSGGGGGGGGVTGSARSASDALDVYQDIVREVSQNMGDMDRALAEARQEQERFADEVRRFRAEPFLNALEDVQRTLTDVFADAFRGTINSLEDFADSFLDIVSRLGANLLSQRLVIPIVAAAGSAFGVTPGDLGIPEGPGAEGLTSLASAGSSILNGLGPSSFGSTIVDALFGGTGPAGAFGPFAPTIGTGLASGASTFLNGAFSGGGAIGGLGGNLLANALFGGDRGIGATIGGTAGGLGGAGIASLIGGAAGGPIGLALGGLLGAFGGNFIGGLFGPNPPSNAVGSQIDTRSGVARIVDPDGERSDENLARAQEIAQEALVTLQALSRATGTREPFREVAGDVSDRDGEFLRLTGANTAGGRIDAQIESSEDITRQVLAGFLEQVEGLGPQLRAAFEGLGDPLEAEIADIEQVIAGAEIFTNIKQQIDNLDADTVGPFEATLSGLRDQWDDFRSTLEAAGLPTERLNTLIATTTREIGDNFVDGLERVNRQLSGDGFLDTILDGINTFESQFSDANFLGRGGDLVAENLRLSLEESLGELNLEQLSALQDFVAGASDGSERFAVATSVIEGAIESYTTAAATSADSLGQTAEELNQLFTEQQEQALDLQARLEQALGGVSTSTALAVAGLEQGEFGFDRLSEVLGQTVVTADDLTAITLFLQSNFLALRDAGVDVGAVFDLVADKLPDAEAAGGTIADSLDTISIAAERLAARTSALTAFEEEVVTRVSGEDAARAFRLTGAGLASFIDDVQSIDAGSLDGSRRALQGFFEQVRTAGLNSDQIALLGAEATAVFDEVSRRAANSSSQIVSETDRIREAFGGLADDIASQVTIVVDRISDGAAQSIASLLSVTDDTIAALQSSFAETSSALARQQADALAAAASVGQALEDLALQGTNPEEAFGIAQARFDNIAARAANGDIGAVNALPSAINDFLDAARLFGPEGTSQFQDALEQARAAAELAEQSATNQAARLGQRLSDLDRQISRQTERLARVAEQQTERIQQAADAQIAEIERQGQSSQEILAALATSSNNQTALLQAVTELITRSNINLGQIEQRLGDLERETRRTNDERAA